MRLCLAYWSHNWRDAVASRGQRRKNREERLVENQQRARLLREMEQREARQSQGDTPVALAEPEERMAQPPPASNPASIPPPVNPVIANLRSNLVARKGLRMKPGF